MPLTEQTEHLFRLLQRDVAATITQGTLIIVSALLSHASTALHTPHCGPQERVIRKQPRRLAYLTKAQLSMRQECDALLRQCARRGAAAAAGAFDFADARQQLLQRIVDKFASKHSAANMAVALHNHPILTTTTNTI